MKKARTDLIQYVCIALLGGLLLLSNLDTVKRFLASLDFVSASREATAVLAGRLEKSDERISALEYDRIRVEDVSNLLLGVQYYRFEKDAFPESLDELAAGGYLGDRPHLTDPETRAPYFYRRRDADFVLCVWLSDMVKGVNTSVCPSSPDEVGSIIILRSPAAATSTPSQAPPPEPRVEIVGSGSVVNVRERPSTAAAIVATVTPGDTFISTETEGAWYRITLDAERSGWIRSDFARALPTP